MRVLNSKETLVVAGGRQQPSQRRVRSFSSPADIDRMLVLAEQLRNVMNKPAT
ncbi:hypothetical protein [Mitsuaria sp. 7]|uniref:hypothetical protein n=1 Tax=Mitsuaria sp. 7 TaxID=1658665 RepID=UPI0012FB87E1|nr:hypothetical protein [Mitsuaria sp. 7]